MRSQTITFIAAGLLLAASAGSTVAADASSRVAGPQPHPPHPDVLGPAGEGRRLFLAFNCYSCHGMAATGGMGPDIVGRDRATVASAVLLGRAGGMPSFRQYVSQTDITNIAAYLNSIGTPEEPMFMDWWKLFPPK
jgi:cytochrome c551